MWNALNRYVYASMYIIIYICIFVVEITQESHTASHHLSLSAWMTNQNGTFALHIALYARCMHWKCRRNDSFDWHAVLYNDFCIFSKVILLLYWYFFFFVHSPSLSFERCAATNIVVAAIAICAYTLIIKWSPNTNYHDYI